MNELQIFKNKEFGEIRTMMIDNKPYFVGKDIALILGYSNPSEALIEHVDKEDKLNSKTLSSLDLDLGQRGGWLINESGLYSLILSSKLPTARQFKRWVTSEVLPAIRKHGAYITPKAMTEYQKMMVETREKNVKIREAQVWLKIADKIATPEYKRICASYASKALAGEMVLPLPKSKEKYMSATEIAQECDTTAQRIGKLSNELGMKTEEWGKWFYDKSPYSNKEVNVFRYNEKALKRFKDILS